MSLILLAGFLGGFDFGPARPLRGGDGGAGGGAEEFFLRRLGVGDRPFGVRTTERFVDGGKPRFEFSLFSRQRLMQGDELF